MQKAFHIVVCAGIVPDPLQTLEPITGPSGPGLKNEMVLPAVLDPWAASALRSRSPCREIRRQQSLARFARPEGQTTTGHDDHRAEG